jgi:competence protein ComEA
MSSDICRKVTAMTALLAAVVLSASVVSEGQVSPRTGSIKAKVLSKDTIDLNSASQAELQNLPGVGEATAQKIIAGRPYAKVDDLAKAGVPERTIERIRSLVHIAQGSAAKTKKGAMAKPVAGKVNVNTADQATLATLPGVGPPMAQAIIAGRPYKSMADLARVRGLGPRRLEALRDRVTFEASEAAEAPAGVAAKKAAARRVAARPAGTKAMIKRAPGEKVNINTATADELDALPGIGPVRARAILEARKNEPFKAIEDIMKVKGIKDGEFAKIKDMITVK